LLVRLNAQITLLTQPRHIDSVSRRLKLLLSDLDRVAAHPAGGRRGTQGGSGHAHTSSGQGAPLAPTHAETLAPMLARLSNTLPHVPHVLARLRTLAALHAAAGEFSQTLDALEAEQRRGRTSLDELSLAIGEVEKSLEANRALVESNVKGLEERVGAVIDRLQILDS
jgi:nuclear migration protein JNM1